MSDTLSLISEITSRLGNSVNFANTVHRRWNAHCMGQR